MNILITTKIKKQRDVLKGILDAEVIRVGSELELNFAHDLICRIIEEAKMAKNDALKHKGKNKGYNYGYDDGRRTAYWEVLTTIQNHLIAFNIKPKKVGFNINPDKDMYNRKKLK